MDTAGLRQLAKQYADGALDKSAYRLARTEYLMTIIEKGAPDPLTQANYTSPRAVAGEETITAATFRSDQTMMLNQRNSVEFAYAQTQPIRLSEQSRLPKTILLAGVVIIVLVVLGLTMLINGGSSDAATNVTSSPGEQQTLSDGEQ